MWIKNYKIYIKEYKKETNKLIHRNKQGTTHLKQKHRSQEQWTRGKTSWKDTVPRDERYNWKREDNRSEDRHRWGQAQKHECETHQADRYTINR